MVKLIYRSKTNPTYQLVYQTDIPYAAWIGYDTRTRDLIIQGVLMKDMTVKVDSPVEDG